MTMDKYDVVIRLSDPADPSRYVEGKFERADAESLRKNPLMANFVEMFEKAVIGGCK